MTKDALLSKLQNLQKESLKQKKEKINTDASFSTLTDEEVLLVLAQRAKKLRIQNNIKQKEFSDLAKLSSPTTYSNFEQTGKVSLLNFIKIVRAFGKLSDIQELLKNDISTFLDNVNSPKKEKKRVR